MLIILFIDLFISFTSCTLQLKNKQTTVLKILNQFMKFKSLKTISILGLTSLTLISCGSKPKSISCDGLDFYGTPISYTADEETFVIKVDGKEYRNDLISFKKRVTVDGSKIIVANEGEISLKECPTELTPAVQYFIP
tara:strand:- start:281 stop:694 length:414 start_codon:yes stop_codon:yes gene_type:complete